MNDDYIKLLSSIRFFEKHNNYKMFILDNTEEHRDDVVIIKDNKELIFQGKYDVSIHGSLGLYIEYITNGYPSSKLEDKPGKYI